MSQLTDNILDVRRGSTIQYPGSYSEYRRSQLKKAPKPQKGGARLLEAEVSLVLHFRFTPFTSPLLAP